MLTSSFYKPARLYFANKDTSKEWYVEYYFLKPGTTDQFQRFKERFDMNRIANAKERFAYGKEAERFMNQKLAEGFNPFKALRAKSGMPAITTQLQIIIKEITRSASKYKIDTLNEQYNRFMKFLEKESLHDYRINEFSDEHANMYRDYLDNELDLSVKTINAALSYLTAIWKHAIKRKKWSNNNPFESVERMKKNQKHVKEERFEPLTSTEIDIITGKLNALNEMHYKIYLGMIFYAWARPAEIARLKVADIDMKHDLIRFSKGDTKNKEGGFVQIVPPLKQLLEKLQIEKIPSNSYVFSGENFAPGYSKLTRNRSSQKWNDIVKAGLKINKDQYALKHTGNIEYLLRNKGNVDLKWQQMQNRHSSSAMTDRYNRKLGAYFIEVGNLNFKQFQ